MIGARALIAPDDALRARAFAETSNLVPDDAAVATLAARACAATGAASTGLALLERARAHRATPDRDLQLALVDLMREAGRDRDALAELDLASRAFPRDPEIAARRGE